MRILLPVLLLALPAGCAAAPKAAPAVAPVAIASDDGTLDFAYGFPAEAAAIPELNAELKADLDTIRGEALGFAREDRSAAAAGQRPFHGHYLHKSWALLGQSERLLSLVAHIESFTGGAHGNTGFQALLWDRAAGRRTRFDALFADASTFATLTRADYCAALDAERLKRRQGERLEGQFAECPAYSELEIAPADADGDGIFEELRFFAGPYVAGPYVEGEYVIGLPVTPALVAALAPDYRDSFVPQRQ